MSSKAGDIMNASINKTKNLPAYKVFWVVIVLDVFVSIVSVLIGYNKADSIGGELFIDTVSMLSKILLTLSVLRDSTLLILGACVPIILKIICAIGIFKHKKMFSLVAAVLYIADFICTLYLFYSNSNMLTELSNYSIILAVSYIFFIGLLVVSFFVLFLLFDETYVIKPFLEKNRKDIKIPVISCLIVILISEIAVIGLSFANKNKFIATKEEIKTVNRCYEYSENYLYEKLPQDKSELNLMLDDINSVIETDTFKRAFNQSNYHRKLIEIRELSKTDDSIDYNGPIIQKSAYVTDLIFLKCKILLTLDKNAEFYDYYNENIKSFSITTNLFFMYVENNLEHFSNDDILTIDELCRNVLKSDDTQKNKCSAWLTLAKLYSSEPNYEIEKKREMTALRKKYISDYDLEKYLKSGLELSEVKDGLYMLNYI